MAPLIANGATAVPGGDQVPPRTKQHRFSLQVEKVPPALRSNTALFAYFDEMFPGKVHSACIAMNVPDLDNQQARRLRVCRRLEKSLAYLRATGQRPTHVAGRPRCRCCGIESTPLGLSAEDAGGREAGPAAGEHDRLPDKGETVDSIRYYALDLARCNLRMAVLQEEKFLIAATGRSPRRRVDGDVAASRDLWYSEPLGLLKSSAAAAAEGLREGFEVSGEEDYLGDMAEGLCGPEYGACGAPGGTSAAPARRARLVDEDHLGGLSGGEGGLVAAEDDDAGGAPARDGRPNLRLRACLWWMGVDFLASSLDEVRRNTDVVVDSVTRPSMSSTGFVTFRTLTPVTVTTSVPLTYHSNPMEVSVAPEPRDLVWQNVPIDMDIGSSRAFVANVLLGLGVLLWSIPLTLIQAWAKVENVALIPGLEWVDAGGTWKPFINGYLPVITLLGIILLLPFTFQLVATSYEKRKTLSDVQSSIIGRYFYYQLANIYITVTAGALWTSAADVINTPQQLLVILGQTFPRLAGYFISLLLTKTLVGLPIVLLRLGALSRMVFLRSCFNKTRLTRRELKEVYRKLPIQYGWEYPTQFLVIIICFTYACITPCVLPVGAVYYFAALLVYKKQALYVYTPTYESGGRMFPQAVSKTLYALLLSQMTFIGYSLIRKAAYQIVLLAPLPFMTVFFHLLVQQRYFDPSKKLSLERAIKIDTLFNQSLGFSDEVYHQPVLTEKASVPMCSQTKGVNNDSIVKEVIENMDHTKAAHASIS